MSYRSLAMQSAGALCPKCGQPVFLDIEIKLHGSAFIERIFSPGGILEQVLYYHRECVGRVA